MDEVDDLTREKLREWQMRRLGIKDQMQDHPEKILELSRVLDLMDEEHEQILSEATRRGGGSAPLQAESAADDGLALQLSAKAQTPEDLRKLLHIALYELDGLLGRQDPPQGAPASYAGGMSGTLGEYRFELGIKVVQQ